MAYPEQSNFVAAAAKSAWWKNAAKHHVCQGVGTGLIVALQLVLRAALKPPWRGFDGVSHSTKPGVDGTWGPITAAAVWAYAGMRGQTDTRGTIAVDARVKRISSASTRLALWLTYYTDRHLELPEGTRFVSRDDPPILESVPLDAIQVPEDAVLWQWGQRPNIPGDLTALGAQYPSCIDEITGADIGATGQIPEIVIVPRTPPPTEPVPPAVVEKSGDSGAGPWFVAAGLAAGAIVIAKRRKRRR